MKEIFIQYFAELMEGVSQDSLHSEAEMLSLITVVLFCFSISVFMKTLLTPIPIYFTERKYGRKALELEKNYKVFAWGVMSLVFLLGLVMSFYKVFTAL